MIRSLFHRLLATCLIGLSSVSAAELRPFPLAGGTVALERADSPAGVFFRAFRPNRATGRWEVDLVVTNGSTKPLRLPLVLRFETADRVAPGITGTVVDGDGKLFLDLTAQAGGSELAPGMALPGFTLSLGDGQTRSDLRAALFSAPEAPPTTQTLVRTLTADGLPLAGVAVEEIGSDAPQSFTSARGGWLTLEARPGVRGWRFQLPGNEPVIRLAAELTLGTVTELPSVRLVATGAGVVQRFSADALPASLPRGWSPAVLVRSVAGAQTVELNEVVPVGRSAVLAQWDDAALVWRAVRTVPGEGRQSVALNFPVAGLFAVLVPDAVPVAPRIPNAGEAVGEVISAVDPATLSATGRVNPVSSPARREAALVTATATVEFSSPAGPLSSGLKFPCQVTEEYQLRDGTRRQLPAFTVQLVGYRLPGAAADGPVVAKFPVRPFQLLAGEELAEAVIRVEVLAPAAFNGGVLNASGGPLADGALRVTAAAGDYARPEAAVLRRLSLPDPTGLVPAGLELTQVFELSVANAQAGKRLTLQTSPVTPNRNFVLARAVFDEGRHGFQPVERMTSDAVGVLSSREPAAGERLPGVDGGGQYWLFQTSAANALVSGIVRDRAAQTAAGVVVRAGPWTAFTDAAGRYQLAAPAGTTELTLLDPRTDDSGSATLTVTADLAAVSANADTAGLGPRVLAASPADGSANVPRVAAVTLTFSRALNPATLLGDAVKLTAPDGSAIPASVSLNLARTAITVLPSAQLPAFAALKLSLAATITDLTARPLEGPREFRFTTESDVLRRDDAALTIFEPVNGFAPMVGGAGMAEPDSPVILVNDTTGFTSTVLSKPDGSFTNDIPADVDDFLSVVLVNRNGTRNTVPASRQVFRDGRVGIFAAGGTIRSAGEGVPVDFIVDPGSIAGKTVFKVESIAPAAFSALVAGKLPAGAGPILGAFELTETGDPLTLAADISVPVKLADLGLPPGADPTNFAFVVVMPLRVDGRVVHQIVDTAAYVAEGPEGGRVRTQSPPFVGMLARKLAGLAASAGMTTITPVRVGSDAENPHKGETAAFGILPLLSQGPLKVGGFVRSVSKNPDGTELVQPLAGATVRMLRVADETDPAGSPVVLDGDLVSISDERGNLGFFFSPSEATATRALVATHPRFPFQKARSAPFAGESGGTTVANAELRFSEPAVNLAAVEGSAPPVVSVGHEPALPQAGRGADDGAVVFVTGVDDRIVNAPELRVLGAQTLLGAVLDPGDVLLTPLPGDADLPGRKVRQFRVQLAQSGRVTLEASVTDDLGQRKTAFHAVSFGVKRPALPPGNPNDLAALRVIFSWPPNGTVNLPALAPITLRFNRALPVELLEPEQLDWLTFEGAHFLRRVEPSGDRRELTVFYDGTTKGPVKLTVGSGAQGESGKFFDQDAGTAGKNPFRMEFTQTAGVETVFDGQTGAGVVMLGRFAYALERGGASGKLRVLDLADPGEPDEFDSNDIGYPTAMALVPNYSLPDADGVCAPLNLLALFTGHANEPKFLQLAQLDDGEVTLGQRLLLSGGGNDGSGRPSVAEGVNQVESLSQVVKAKWDAPYLGYFELGADVTSIKLLNLTSFHRVELQKGRLDSFGVGGGNDGVDANGDGDFCDAGDQLPVPSGDPLVTPGLAFSFAPKTRAERIEDFDFHAGLGLVVSVSRFLGGDLPPRFSTLLAASDTNSLDGAIVSFTTSDTVRRVLLLPGTTLQTPTNQVSRDLALVTLGQASGDGALAVIDVTVPSAPALLNRFTLPPGEGSPGSIQRRTDGLLALATARSTLMIDPARLILPNRTLSHASIVGRIDGTGTGSRDFVADAAGLNFTHGGANRRYVETAPQFSFVRFNALINPAVIAAQPPAIVEGFLRTASRVSVAEVTSAGTGSVAPTPDPERHYYVLVDAPGGAAQSDGLLPLVLSAVDANGLPQPDRGGTVVPAVVGDEQLEGALLGRRVIELVLSVLNLKKGGSRQGAGGEIGVRALLDSMDAELGNSLSLKKLIAKLSSLGSALRLLTDRFEARRLSDDPDHPLYNRFLAGPFVILGGAPTVPQLAALKDQAAQLEVNRAYLRPSPRLWVGLPSERERSFLTLPRPFDPTPSRLKPFVSQLRLNPTAEIGGVQIPGSTALIEELARLSQLNPVGNFFDFGEQVTLSVALLNNLPLLDTVIDGEWNPLLLPGAHALLRVNHADRPMVLVPGFAGSKLEVNGANEWLSLSLFEESRKQRALLVKPDGQPLFDTFATDALRFTLETPIKNLGSIYADWIAHLTGELGMVEYDFLKDGPGGETIRKRLRLDGQPILNQSPSPNLFVFPYDWRLNNQQAAEQLKDYVRLALELNPDSDGVDLVGHSNGGLVSRAFMLLPGQRPLVKRFITVGTPWLGAPKVMAGLRTGDMNETKINIITPIGAVQQMLQFAPGAHQLLPTKEYFQLGFRPLVEDGFDLNTNGLPNESFTFDGYMDAVAKHFLREPAVKAATNILRQEFRFEDLPGGEHPARENANRFYAQRISDHRLDAADVEMHHIVGLGTSPDTIGQIRVRGRLVSQPARTNVVASVARVASFETEQVRDGADLLISPGDGQLAVNPTNQYRLNEEIEVRYVAGDGTVPIGSLARGRGSNLDFNAPGARLYPLVGGFDDDLTGHNPMLNTPAFLDLFAAIYSGRKVEEIALALPEPAGFAEGSLGSITVTATPPPGTTGVISHVVDFGDGSVDLRRVADGTAVTVPHRYRQSGTYLVTVGAATDNGVSGLTSQQVVVANVPPTVEIEGGDLPVDRGDTRILTARVTDPGLDDRHDFRWTLPGGVVSGQNQFAVPVTFDEPGTQIVTVRVIDSDGAEATSSVTVTVGPDPTGLAGANFGPDSARSSLRIRRAALDGFEGGHPEFIVRVNGHAAGTFDTIGLAVRQEGVTAGVRSLLGGVFDRMPALTTLGNAFYERLILPSVARFLGRAAQDTDYARALRELPDELLGIDFAATRALVGATGKGGPIEVDLLYLEGGIPRRLFRWQAGEVSSLEGVRLTFEWDTNKLSAVLQRVIPEVTTGSPLNGTSLGTIEPVFTAASEQAAGDRSGPATVGILNPATDLVTILGRDNLTAATALKFFAVFDSNENGRLDDDTFYPLDTNVVTFARLPERPFAVVGVDEQGNVGGLDPFHVAETRNFLTDKAPVADKSLYEEKLVAIRGAVRAVVQEARVSPLIAGRYLLAPAHLWVFEQGSGANLWKSKFVQRCNGIYLPGKSDNDYELFLPVHLATPYGFNEADRARFEADGPHEPATLTGDWYFRRPTGLDANGVPTGDDGAIVTWEYALPGGFLVEGQPSFQVERRANDDKLDEGFRSPLTPAEVIARVFTQTVTGNPAHRKLLPDTSFFPERSEHFKFGHLHLQRPPEFGDDPIGDGGTGRQLLMLKWLLEGAYVTLNDDGDTTGLNADAPTLTEIFANWQRVGVPLAEGLEWGLFQDFAALKSRPFQVASIRLSSTGEGDRLRILQRSADDAVAVQQASRLKKLGKSAIRATLARLAGDTNLNALVADEAASRMTVNPVRSFENFILELARGSAEALAAFGDFASDRDDRTEPPDLGDFLKAKNGDKEYLATIIHEPGAYERFVTNTFIFLRDFVQRPTQPAYADYTAGLRTDNRAAELLQRTENLNLVVRGRGPTQPGLLALMTDRRISRIELPVSVEVYGPGSAGTITVTGRRTSTRGDGPNAGPRIARSGEPNDPDGVRVAQIEGTVDLDDTLDGTAINESLPTLEGNAEESTIEQVVSAVAGDSALDDNTTSGRARAFGNPGVPPVDVQTGPERLHAQIELVGDVPTIAFTVLNPDGTVVPDGRVLLFPLGPDHRPRPPVETNRINLAQPPAAIAATGMFLAEGRVGSRETVNVLALTVDLSGLHRNGRRAPTVHELGTLLLLHEAVEQPTDLGIRLRALAFAQLVRSSALELANLPRDFNAIMAFAQARNIRITGEQAAFEAGIARGPFGVLPMPENIQGEFNPGRHVQNGPNLGLVFINENLVQAALRNPPDVRFTQFGTLFTMDALEVFKLEVLHELDARLVSGGHLDLATPVEGPIGNFVLDAAVVRLSPQFNGFATWAAAEAALAGRILDPPVP